MQDWVKDKVQAGLYKRPRDTGAVWAVKARIKGGNPITLTIGKTNLFTPQKARSEAKRLLALLAQGVNPSDEQKNQKIIKSARSLTLGAAIEQYAKIASWKDKTRHDATSTLLRRFGDWYNRPLASITKEECQTRFLKIKAQVVSVKGKRDKQRAKENLPIKQPNNEIGLGEAQRAFRYLSAVFASYSQDSAGEGKLLPNGNPCLVLKTKKLRKALKPKERYLNAMQRCSLYDTLAASFSEEYPGYIKQVDADLIWLLIHTGLRLDEARTLAWTAVDFIQETFTAYDTKNHSDHTLPMTEATKIMFLRRFESGESGHYVFPSPLDSELPMSASRSFDRVCAESGFEFSAHDLRRTVATVAAELGYDLEAIGSILNHAKRGVTAGYIQHTHKRLKKILIDIQDALFAQPYEQPAAYAVAVPADH